MRAVLQAGAYLGGYAGILFGGAGRLDWPMAWAVIGLNAVFTMAAFLVVDPDLIRERSRPGPDFDRRDALLASLNAVYLESNYDPHLLETGPYPRRLKQRITGSGGHLSNVEAAELVAHAASRRLRWIALSHLS